MKHYFPLCLAMALFCTRTAHAQNHFPASGNVGINTGTSPASMLEIRNHTLAVAASPFITLNNRGSNNNYANTHVIGGLMGASYRDVRDPAYVAGMWFERAPALNNLSSQGSIIFGTTANPVYLNEGLPVERMRITSAGSVGIGTAVPEAMLHVEGQMKCITLISGTGANRTGFMGRAGAITGGWSAIPNAFSITYYLQDFVIGGWGKSDSQWKGASLFINSDNGNVLIGKTTQANANYKLDVNGNIRANKITVNTTGADFVFGEEYALPTLHEVEQYIKKHKHLPGIAPAVEMQQEGMDVGDQQTKLLQKVEELTLYIIEINKKLEAQQKLIEQQAKALQAK